MEPALPQTFADVLKVRTLRAVIGEEEELLADCCTSGFLLHSTHFCVLAPVRAVLARPCVQRVAISGPLSSRIVTAQRLLCGFVLMSHVFGVPCTKLR